MAVAEKITEQVQELPEPMQREVLDFIEYLLTRTEREAATDDDRQWSRRSLSLAMGGMEDEDAGEYSIADLKESF